MNHRSDHGGLGTRALARAALVLALLGPPARAGTIEGIDTGAIDLTQIASVDPVLNSAKLVKWRSGIPNTILTSGITNLSLAYLGSGTNLPFPDRAIVGDNSANDQGDLWTDNAIEVDYVKGNAADKAILIYTDNQDNGPSDPLYGVALRGGLVGGAGCAPTDSCYQERAGVLPLLWKAITRQDLEAVSTATVKTAATPANPIPDSSPMYIPTEVLETARPQCPAEGPYPASTRPAPYEVGFCDYSTHFFSDANNRYDPKNLFYTLYPAGSAERTNAFRYTSLVGPFGINTTENGLGGGGSDSPMYAVLGLNMLNATLSRYATTIYVELRQL